MGRRPRIHYPGAVYHVMARGVAGQNIFIDDEDRRGFLRSLDRIKLGTNAVVYAYCLMGNHFHLAIKVPDLPLSEIMQRLLTSYSKTFNFRHVRTGHLFQARYKSIICLDDRYLLSLIRYIQMNPVRAGLVANPEEWQWSSRSPVELPNLDEDGFNPWPKDENRPTLTRLVVPQVMTMGEIGTKVSESCGIAVAAIRSRTKCKQIVKAKIQIAAEGVRQGQRIKAIADWLNCQSQAVSYYLRKNSTNFDA